MAWSTPSTQVAGTLISAATWNQDVVDNAVYLHAPPYARVYHNTTQSAPDSTLTDLAFNSEHHDTDGMHDTVTNNERLTCQTAGVYFVSANIEISSAGIGSHLLYIFFNFSLVDKRVGGAVIVNESSGDVILSANATVQLAVNEYVKATYFQQTGGSETVNRTSDYSPIFTAQWLGAGGGFIDGPG